MRKLPDLEGLAIFTKVVDAGGFARAAEDLGLSKATLSKAVARLERRLGARLLHRTSRRLALTDAGRDLLEGAKAMLTAAEAAEDRALDLASAPRGLVRIAAPMSFGLAYVAPALPDLLALYPWITIDLHCADELIDLIGGGFDVAVRIGALADSSLMARRLCDIARHVVGSPAYFERHGAPHHPRDLAAHECLTYSNLPTPELWRFFGPGGEEATARPLSRVRSNNADALMPMALAGAGLALQPDFISAPYLRDGRLKTTLTDWSPPPIGLHLVTPPGGPRPARVNAVIEFLAARFSGAPWRFD